jgi:hypothetical protein
MVYVPSREWARPRTLFTDGHDKAVSCIEYGQWTYTLGWNLLLYLLAHHTQRPVAGGRYRGWA